MGAPFSIVCQSRQRISFVHRKEESSRRMSGGEYGGRNAWEVVRWSSSAKSTWGGGIEGVRRKWGGRKVGRHRRGNRGEVWIVWSVSDFEWLALSLIEAGWLAGEEEAGLGNKQTGGARSLVVATTSVVG